MLASITVKGQSGKSTTMEQNGDLSRFLARVPEKLYVIVSLGDTIRTELSAHNSPVLLFEPLLFLILLEGFSLDLPFMFHVLVAGRSCCFYVLTSSGKPGFQQRRLHKSFNELKAFLIGLGAFDVDLRVVNLSDTFSLD